MTEHHVVCDTGVSWRAQGGRQALEAVPGACGACRYCYPVPGTHALVSSVACRVFPNTQTWKRCVTCLRSHVPSEAEAGLPACSLDPGAVPSPPCLAPLTGVEMDGPGSGGRQASSQRLGWLTRVGLLQEADREGSRLSDSRGEGEGAGM